MHKVLGFKPYEIAPPSSSAHEVNLVGDEHGSPTIAQNISLEQLYEHITPGSLLYLKEDIPKSVATNFDRLRSENVALKHRTFGVLETGSIPGNKKHPQGGKGRGHIRITPISLSSPSAHFKLAMDRSYQFIEHGSPVEFSLRIKGSQIKKQRILNPDGDVQAWIWVHEHFPHLRPDFILKSMPEGSRFLIDPVSDGQIIQFVIARRTQGVELPSSLTRRLFTVHESVATAIKKRKYPELPRDFPTAKYEVGHEEGTSTLSSPSEQVGGVDDAEGEAKSEAADTTTSPPSADRYMPASKARTPPHERWLDRQGRWPIAKPSVSRIEPDVPQKNKDRYGSRGRRNPRAR